MKKNILILSILIIISITPLSYAQLTIGDPAKHKSIEITINESGDAHVVHTIDDSKKIRQVHLIDGTISNLNVKDENGNDAQYGTSGTDDSMGISLFPNEDDVLIEYDLTDVLSVDEHGKWIWEFSYAGSVTFYFPDNIDLIFANNRPVYIGNTEGLTCHGCLVQLEYVLIDDSNTIKVKWEEHEFDLYIKSPGEIDSFEFDQSEKRISFETTKKNQLVTLAIPLELLWQPYEVFSNDRKILKHEFMSNETHAWLSMRPNMTGTVDIIGTSVVPEFPLFAPLVIGVLMVVALQFRNKINLR